MRIFQNFPEAFEEIRRDLAEMGVDVHTRTMQDKLIEEDESFATKELQNYIYTVTEPKFDELKPTQPWADEEWTERYAGARYGLSVNPGIAYKKRSDVWEEFLHRGRFEYTYSERFASANQVNHVINALKRDPMSRQLYVAMWQPTDSNKLGDKRVPCSLGWHFMHRQGKLNVTYFMRSCDFSTHFQNDIYLSMKLQHLIAEEANVEPGMFTHFMGSLHVYKKDVADVF